MTSETPTPGRCNACRDGQYCENYPVDGSTRCRMHGGTAGSGAPTGEPNGNYRHGAYMIEWPSNLEASDANTYPELVEEIADPGEERDVARELAAELIAVRFVRSPDPDFLRGFVEICSAYGIFPES